MGSHSHARKRVRHRVSAVTSSVARSSVLISGPSQELVTRGHSVYPRGEPGNLGRPHVTINLLPDDVLLEIFDIHIVNEDVHHDRWHALVHVCRRWRTVVFASARRLNLQLRCTYRRPVRKKLNIWPALPITIEDGGTRVKGASNIIAAFKHPDRVRSIDLGRIPNSVLKRFAAAMKDPFPTLTYLRLFARDNKAPVLPDSFLGGSAPRLQTLDLSRIPFPGIPNLLLSASDLIDLHLLDIPHSGYISPEAMVAGLSTLTRLELLHIHFQSPRSRPGQLSPPRPTRAVLPALNYFEFKGVSEYLEDLTSRIDAPLLSYLRIIFFNQLIFNTPRLCAFISRVEKLRSQSQANMTFSLDNVKLSFVADGRPGLVLTIRCKPSDWQLSSLTQVCDSPFVSLFNLERLEIREDSYLRPHWQEDVENIQWPELFHPFTTIKSLSLSKEFTPCVVPALQELSASVIWYFTGELF
ncbi:hypothetical protein BC826DRAFT_1108872 [Russula brevipes]|nr:hypothetical protein BC826DRAFT_1108872 [Russula brevipes]